MKRLISIIKPAVNENQAKATTGAVDKYVVKSFIKVNILKLIFLLLRINLKP